MALFVAAAPVALFQPTVSTVTLQLLLLFLYVLLASLKDSTPSLRSGDHLFIITFPAFKVVTISTSSHNPTRNI